MIDLSKGLCRLQGSLTEFGKDNPAGVMQVPVYCNNNFQCHYHVAMGLNDKE